MSHNQIPSRVAAPHQALTSTVAAIATAVPLLLGSSLASGETRGYVISWFATATNNPDFAAFYPVTGKNRMISVTWRMEAVPAFLATETGQVLATASSDELGGQVHETVASNGQAQTPTNAAH